MPRIKKYYLHRWYVKHGRRGTIYVHLHGRQFANARYGGAHYSEYHTLHNLPGASFEELVRCAVAQSSMQWKVTYTTNRMQFDGKFYKPLDARLQAALTGQSGLQEPQDVLSEPPEQPSYPQPYQQPLPSGYAPYAPQQVQPMYHPVQPQYPRTPPPQMPEHATFKQVFKFYVDLLTWKLSQ